MKALSQKEIQKQLDLDFSKLAKYRFPEEGEESCLFKIKFYNENNNGLTIEWVNSGFTINPTFVVEPIEVFNI